MAGEDQDQSESRKRDKRVRAIFTEALKLPASELAAFIREQCGEDTELADELGQLLSKYTETAAPLSGAPSLQGAHPLDTDGEERTRRVSIAFTEVIEQPRAARTEFVQTKYAHDSEFAKELLAMVAVHEEAIHDPQGSDLTRHEHTGMTLPPGALVNHFKIKKQIGEGGFGEVYLAEQISPIRRTVALKVIKLGMDTREVISRFESERQALAIMNNAAIARLLEAGATDKGRPYFVMEYIDGRPITAFCDEEALNIESRLQIFLQACSAIQHAHDNNVIHRDIKPRNILVTTNENCEPEAKIIDFGIAKAMSQESTGETLRTQDGVLIGTPEYMAPERTRIEHSSSDPRLDIYSLGVVLYELLCGTLPLDRELLRKATTSELERLLREKRPPSPSSRLMSLETNIADEITSARSEKLSDLHSHLRGKLDFIVLKCLRKNPDERYQSVQELETDIERYLAGERLISPSEWVRDMAHAHIYSKPVRAGILLATLLLILASTIMLTVDNRDTEPTNSRLNDLGELQATPSEENYYKLLAKGNDLLKSGRIREAEIAYEQSLNISVALHRSDMVEWSKMRLAAAMLEDGRCNEAIENLMMYSKVLLARSRSPDIDTFDKHSLDPLVLYYRACRECGSEESMLEIVSVFKHLLTTNETAKGMPEIVAAYEENAHLLPEEEGP